MTISLVVGYLKYRLGQVGNGHLLYVYFGSDWGTVVKIGLLGTMAAPKSGGMHFATVSISTFPGSKIYTIIESSFHPTPSNPEWSYQKGHWFPNPTPRWHHCKVVADWRCTDVS